MNRKLFANLTLMSLSLISLTAFVSIVHKVSFKHVMIALGDGFILGFIIGYIHYRLRKAKNFRRIITFVPDIMLLVILAYISYMTVQYLGLTSLMFPLWLLLCFSYIYFRLLSFTLFNNSNAEDGQGRYRHIFKGILLPVAVYVALALFLFE